MTLHLGGLCLTLGQGIYYFFPFFILFLFFFIPHFLIFAYWPVSLYISHCCSFTASLGVAIKLILIKLMYF